MHRHSKMHDLATGMIQGHKNVRDLKANRRHREEVHGPGHFEVMRRKVNQVWDLSVPSLCLTIHFPDGVWAAWIETE
jgi:hypothetical protein